MTFDLTCEEDLSFDDSSDNEECEALAASYPATYRKRALDCRAAAFANYGNEPVVTKMTRTSDYFEQRAKFWQSLSFSNDE